MCYQQHHNCDYCQREYLCQLINKLCPTINYDKDKNLCDDCRAEFERDANKLNMDEMEFKWSNLL